MTTAPTTDTAPAETAATAEPPAGAVLAAPTGGLSLRKNFSWTFVGNVVYAACQWGILVVLAKLGTPEMVGQFALGLAITAPVIMFSQLQLRGVQATDAKREYQFGDYLALRLITTALALVVIFGIVAVSGYKRETALVILIVGAMKGVDALSDVYYGLWQQHERMDGIAQALMLNGVVSTAALVALMAATHNIVVAVLGSAAGSATAFLFTLAKNRRLALAAGQAARPNWNTRLLWRLTRLALPLGIVTLLLAFNGNVPRYFIQHYLGATSLGIFAAAVYATVITGFVVAALSQAVSPRLAAYYSGTNSRAYLGLLLRVSAIGAIVGAAGTLMSIFWGRQLLTVLYRPEYGSSANVLTIAMLGAGLGYIGSFLGCAMTAARYFTVQIPLFATTLAAVVATCLILVPRIGLVGAAWASVIAATIHIIGATVVVRHALTNCNKDAGFAI